MNKMDGIKNMNGRLGYIVVITFWVIILMSLTSCVGTYYLTDAEYDDAREEHLAITYYNSEIYWGWNEGFYYYYGTPHYYPWYYYYNICPPSHHSHNTHVIINRPVNRPTHRPNIHRPSIRTNSNTKVIVKPNRNTNVKTNTNRNRVNVNKSKNNSIKINKTNTIRNNKTNRNTNTKRRPR